MPCIDVTPRALTRHYGAGPHTRERHDKRVGSIALAFIRGKRALRLYFSDRGHLASVERNEDAVPLKQKLSEAVRPAFQLVADFFRRVERASRDGAVELIPNVYVNVGRMSAPYIDPDACVDHVGRRQRPTSRLAAGQPRRLSGVSV